MNLVIDTGNTQSKVGIFDKGNLIYTNTTDIIDKKYIKSLFFEYKIENAILSTVAKLPNNETMLLLNQQTQTFINLSAETKLPFINLYKTPNTLGKDRLAAIAGAQALFPNENVLAIDAGTAITYDCISKDSEYIGGNISPGLTMRYKALNHFTQKLPELSQSENTPLLGLTTNEAIISGVQNGAIMEIDGFISEIVKKKSISKTIITGGDSVFFANNVKNPIFVHQNLVLIGLNRILNYNAL